jgi:Arc/MetJ-type ribon-helix-helix transcriptional regulator
MKGTHDEHAQPLYTGCASNKHGDWMALNVNLGTPYELIIKKLIERGYAGNQTEVIRQALMYYEKYLRDEEIYLVGKAAEAEMRKIRSGKIKTKPLSEILKKYSK